MAILLRYEKVPRPDGTLRNAPYIPIFVRTAEGRLLRLVALLDTGADCTVLPKDLAMILGVKEQGAEFETGGIGGIAKARACQFRFDIRGSREHYSLSVRALVIQDHTEDIPLILGRNGFLEHFDVTIKQAEGKIILKKVANKRYE